MAETNQIKVSHSLSTIIATLTLVISLIGSWSWFYAEQRLNTQARGIQEKTITTLQNRTSELEEIQYKMIITVDNNSKTIGEVSDSMKEVVKIINDNQKYLIKIVNKNKLE